MQILSVLQPPVEKFAFAGSIEFIRENSAASVEHSASAVLARISFAYKI